MNTLRSVKGMHDILPPDIGYWQQLEQIAQELFVSYGYQELRVPVVEKTELFERAIGEVTDVVEKEMYSFVDESGHRLSLRPEGTAGVVRAMLQHGCLYGPALKYWYQGPMFRREQPQHGRTRQFHQIGVEVFGLEGPDIDAELLLLCHRLWQRLGLNGLRLQLNSLGTAAERSRFKQALVEYLNQFRHDLDADSQRRLERNPLRILDSKNSDTQAIVAGAPRLSEYLGQESQAHFEQVLAIVDAVNVPYEVNHHLVRGLDYYSHTVFEWISDELGAQGTVCAGGRYNSLIEYQGGKAWPGIGFAMGQERLVELMRANEGPHQQQADAYLVLAGEGAVLQGMKLAETIRDRLPELKLLCNAGGGSFKAQFKRADRSGARLALLLGAQEIEDQVVAVRPLQGEDKTQIAVPRDEIVPWLQRWINDNQ